jgi:NAD(P)-dependent dehydrogenase (short-subunit alcohol dehydrogenase family)
MSNNNNNNGKTALVTGANSGIGFEAAALLAEDGFSTVILACRTVGKAETAKSQLVERVGKDVFEVLAVDVSEPQSANKASDVLKERKSKIDLLILNAGMSTGTERAYNSDGVELTFASTLVGHHIMTMRLLEEKLLADNARIVIAGSEGARGGPGMNIPDFSAFAAEHFDGNLEAALETIARVQPPYDDTAMSIYVTAKVYVAWWAAALSRKLPAGMIVNAVSPGAVPGTSFARNMSSLMRFMMGPVMSTLGSLVGMNGSSSDGARRYIDAGDFDDKTTGHFYASAPGKMTGSIEIQKDSHFLNQVHQDAFWNVLVRLTGGLDYSASA